MRSQSSDCTERLTRLLAERADKAAADITAILNELRTAIQDQLNDPDYQQRFLPGLAPVVGLAQSLK